MPKGEVWRRAHDCVVLSAPPSGSNICFAWSESVKVSSYLFSSAHALARTRPSPRQYPPGGAHAPGRTPPPPNSRRTYAPSHRSNAERRGQRVGLALLEAHLEQILHAQHVEVRF